DIEELEEIHLDAFRAKYEALAELARKNTENGILDTDTPETDD
ncbi:MAG: low affinity iron permease family protein, partial [Methyloglobulus sp.]|nr:low affinity iron permease family protein [Methyloglobulus sp.]